MKNNQKSFPATLQNLPDILSWIRLHIDRTALDETEKKRIEIALEEAIVNIIHHSQTDKAFQIACSLQPRRQIEFILKDFGLPFNPLLHESQTLSPPKEGGLGILFMKKYMDAIFYRREEEANILTLIKNL